MAAEKITLRMPGGNYRETVMGLRPSMFLPLGAGSGLTDLSGNGRNGTAGGGVTIGGYSPGPLTVADDGATDFDGTNDRIDTSYYSRQNLITNPSFENASVTGWTTTSTDWTSVASYSTPVSGINQDGTYGLYTTGTKDATATTRHFDVATAQMAVSPNVAYSFKAHSLFVADAPNTGGAGGGVLMYVQWLTAASAHISFSFSNTVTANGITTVQGTATAPPTAAFAIVTLRTYSSTASDTFQTFWDAIVFERAAAPGTYFPTTAQLASGEAGWTGTPHASISNIGPLANGTARTFMGWANRDSTSGNHTLFGGSNNGIYGILLRIPTGTNDVQFFPDAGSGATTFSAAWPGAARWTHWALTFVSGGGSNNVRLFIDGQLVGTATNAATFPTGSAVEIGSWALTHPWDGKQALFSVHTRALTATEIAAVYASSATGAEINLTDGTTWTTEAFDLGNAADREEFLVGADSDGALPARVPRLDNREVTFTLRGADAGSMDAVLTNIGALDKFLQAAKTVAAGGVTDPMEYARIDYTPQDSTQAFFLPVFGGKIDDVPKELSGESAGWFIRRPVVTLRTVCSPAGYGALRSYLDTRTTDATAVSATVAGGPGDLPPWIRARFTDAATKQRGRLTVGVRNGETSNNPEILASAFTLYAGTLSSGYLTSGSSFTDWQTAAALPAQSRTGTFRVYLSRASSATSGKFRFSWAESGGSRRVLNEVAAPVAGAGYADVYLGEINPSSAWNGWIECFGVTSAWSVVLVPTDSFVEAVGPLGTAMIGATGSSDDLLTASTHVSGRAMTVGGSWSTAGVNSGSPNWPVTVSAGLTRTTSGGGFGFAQAGTTDRLNVNVAGRLYLPTYDGFLEYVSDDVFAGIYARYSGTTTFLTLGLSIYGTGNGILSSGIPGSYVRPVLMASNAGVKTTLWKGTPFLAAEVNSVSRYLQLNLQVTDAGYWSAKADVIQAGAKVLSSAGTGFSGLLIGGEPLGVATAKQGVFDNAVALTTTRRWTYFRAHDLAGITPQPIPTGSSLILAGPEMLTADAGKYPYFGSSGLSLAPGQNNNLTVFARRSPDTAAVVGSASTDPLDIDLEGYPRYATVPY